MDPMSVIGSCAEEERLTLIDRDHQRLDLFANNHVLVVPLSQVLFLRPIQVSINSARSSGCWLT